VKALRIDYLKSAGRLDECPRHNLAEIAFLGRSNVGKSSLLNTLAGLKRLARVSSTPGRTRRLHFYKVHGPTPMVLVDLPGFGYAKASKSEKNAWTKAMTDYLNKRENLVGVVLVTDIRRGGTDSESEVISALEEQGRQIMLVATKADKVAKNRLLNSLKTCAKGLGMNKASSIIPFSSKTKQGRMELWAKIEELVKGADK